MKKLKQGFATVLAVCLFAAMSFAQQGSTINIDQLSDQQLQQYLGMANGSGMSEADAIAKAKEKGLSDDQIQKLRIRIQSLNSGSSTLAKPSADNADFRSGVVTKSPSNQVLNINGLPVFGSSLFAKENLTFEPNLQIPTPVNYQIGTGDQLNIDLFGYSDANFKLKVSPDGTIRIPNLGPVKLAGLSFEAAQQKIRSQLAKIYPQIASGQTSIQVTLGTIRSIRVTLIGEIQKPGTYTLSSLATIANALYVSGGPDMIGSYRDIQLVRNGKTIAVFDLYDFLLKGDLTKNLRLEDDDIIKVSPYGTRVIITGAIKRKAIYEAKKNETLDDLVSIAGGFDDYAYKSFIRVERNTKSAREAITVNADQFKSFALLSGDYFRIDSISTRFTNRVVITGAVYHPGVYSTQEFSTLKTLLQTAGLREEAYLQRAMIKRRNENYIPKAIDVNLVDILSNKTDIALQREDSIRIFSLIELRPKDSVTINGEVNKPGSFNYADGLQLQDLILMSGGFSDAASRAQIEVARRIRDSSEKEGETDKYAIVTNIELNKLLDKTAQLPLVYLQPYDIVSVRRDPAYKEQITVDIQGEVLYPGKYTVENNKETISTLVNRAGGLRTTAYPEGGILLRNTFSDTIQSNLSEDRINNIRNQARGADSLGNLLISSIGRAKKIVGINLEKAIQQPHSGNDILLQAGDLLSIPKFPETVQSFGSVYVPKKVIYTKGLSFRKVIDESGGFLVQASRKKSYVMYPNGEIKGTKHFLFFRFYPEIRPGSEVYVPVKDKRSGLNMTDFTMISAAFTGILTVVILAKSVGL